MNTVFRGATVRHDVRVCRVAVLEQRYIVALRIMSSEIPWGSTGHVPVLCVAFFLTPISVRLRSYHSLRV